MKLQQNLMIVVTKMGVLIKMFRVHAITMLYSDQDGCPSLTPSTALRFMTWTMLGQEGRGVEGL